MAKFYTVPCQLSPLKARLHHDLATISTTAQCVAQSEFDRPRNPCYKRLHNSIISDAGTPTARKRGVQWGKTGSSPALSRNCSLERSRKPEHPPASRFRDTLAERGGLWKPTGSAYHTPS